jgi:hypothetical protein
MCMYPWQRYPYVYVFCCNFICSSHTNRDCTPGPLSIQFEQHGVSSVSLSAGHQAYFSLLAPRAMLPSSVNQWLKPRGFHGAKHFARKGEEDD